MAQAPLDRIALGPFAPPVRVSDDTPPELYLRFFVVWKWIGSR